MLADLRLYGESAERLIELAVHLLDWGNETVDLDGCERALRRALELEPDHPEACLELAHFLDSIENRPIEALPWFERALGRIDDPSATWGHARCLAQLGRMDDALAAIDASPQRDEPEVAKVREEIAAGEWDLT
jgi:hypothetical protein